MIEPDCISVVTWSCPTSPAGAANGCRPNRTTALPTPPPDWVCEILSPSTARLDRGPKRRIYAEAGVGHLWLLDPTDGVLEGFALTGGHWLLLGTVARGETVTLPPFDAVSFPLDDLFPFDDPAAPPPAET